MVFDYPAFAAFMKSQGCDTLTKIAAELGVPKSAISRLQNGKQRPSIDFIALIWWKYADLPARQFLRSEIER